NEDAPKTDEKVPVTASVPRPVNVKPQSTPNVADRPSESIPSPLSERSRASRSVVKSLEQTSAKLKTAPHQSDKLLLGQPRRRVIIAAATLITLIIIISLSVALFGGGEATETPTAIAAAETEQAVSTDEPTTEASLSVDSTSNSDVDTPLPVLATDAPPTDEPEDNSVNVVPATDVAVVVLPDSIPITLIYNEDTLYLHNTADVTVDVSDLVFFQQATDPETTLAITVAVDRIWNRGRRPPEALLEGDCYQVWSQSRFSILPPPPFCSREGFYGVRPNNDFWIEKENVGTFEVRLDGEPIAVCEITDGECMVPVPLAN
ncbi:MAG: hypothetical protein AAF125_14755, partial [Chloroflexota bacterium]